MKDVTRVVAAAVAVERGGYTTGSLFEVAQREDELGTLARVFDNMVTGIKDREQRLRSQIDQLKEEISGVSEAPVENDGEDSLGAGDIFAERYRIERPLGKGGMGMVYLATDLELGEPVAIKTLRSDILTEDETAIERFRNEIRLARRIAHRNIVRTHDLGKSGDVFFLTMEYVEGATLRSVLDSRGHLGAEAMLAIAKQLADALKSAHEDGIIHRDIKPQNILLQGSGAVKVMDFGVARLAERSVTLTQAGLVVGTPTYMAPEQLLDEDVDPRSDLYSAGVVLYECLTGRPPFEARTPIALITKILHEPAPLPETLVPGIPQRVSSMVMSLLEKDPAKRIQSASDLGALLLQLI
jgi:serine/threonine protein kinase